MSLTTGFILGSLIMVLGSCGIAAFGFWLGWRDGKEREARSVILRVDSYRTRQQ